MSRSFHATRRHLEEAAGADYADANERERWLEDISADLDDKRRTKQAVRRGRAARLRSGTQPPPGGAALRIHVERAGPHAWSPSEMDVRAILDALPPDMICGIAAVHVGLGTSVQREYLRREPCEDYSPDPFTGRPGEELFPGAYGPPVYGAFVPDHARIELYAYVCRADHPHRRSAELYFRLRALETLLHEIAHHGDEVSRRRAGERGGADGRQKFAASSAHRWFGEHVLPYLRTAYRADVDAGDRGARARHRAGSPRRPGAPRMHCPLQPQVR